MKTYAKALLNLIAEAVVLPLVLAYRLNLLINSNERCSFRPFSEFLSLLPGTTGQYLRRAFYKHSVQSCASDCYIGFGTLLATPKSRIGSKVYIGSQCSLGSVNIEDDTLVASGVRVISGLAQHGIDDLSTPIREQDGSYETINIGRDCWIGEGAIISANIGAHSIVAAGSVVIEEVEPYSIVAGNPARLIRSRKEDSNLTAV